MEECTAALASLTYAIKAQRSLSLLGIDVRVVKLDPSRAKRGCEYGIAYPCELHSEIKQSLRSSGIGVRRFMKGGGEIV